MPSKYYPDGRIVPGTTWSPYEYNKKLQKELIENPGAVLTLTGFRPETTYQKRLRLIARWRQRRLLEWLGTFEPGKAPYGVKQ